MNPAGIGYEIGTALNAKAVFVLIRDRHLFLFICGLVNDTASGSGNTV
jgi:hypothetical protein